MAVSFKVSAAGQNGGAGPDSFALNTSGAVNVDVVVTVLQNGTGAPTVTYNSVSLGSPAATSADAGNGYKLYVFNGLVATGGNFNVGVTAGTGGTDFYTIASAYADAAQSGQPDATAVGIDTIHANFSTPLTMVADNCWLVGVSYNLNGAAHTAGSNTTLRQSGGFVAYQLWDSNGARTPPGSQALNLVVSSGNTAWVVISIAPVAVGETITIDKWIGNQARFIPRAFGMVPSGTIGIKS